MRNNQINITTENLIQIIRSNRSKIISILTEVESYQTATDEIKLSLDMLINFENQSQYLENNFEKLKFTSVFMPLNLPLYSILLFILIPTIFSKKVYVRYPIAIRGTIEILFDLLMINNDNKIVLTTMQREEFIIRCCSISDVIVFIGKYINAKNIMLKCPYSFFIHNGGGANPILVTGSAKIDDAVRKTVKIRAFNSGQDCAAPDAILVDNKVCKLFLEKLTKEVKNLTKGAYSDKDVTIGETMAKNVIPYIERYLENNKKHIYYNGGIDKQKSYIFPHILHRDIKDIEKITFDEFFSPIFNIIEYKNEEELERYFNKDYEKKSMVLSIFGDFIKNDIFKKSIILKDKTLLDVDDGNKPFGGYGIEASFVGQYKKIITRPVLVSEEIDKWLKNNQKVT